MRSGSAGSEGHTQSSVIAQNAKSAANASGNARIIFLKKANKKMSGTYWRALPTPTTVLGKHRFVGTERSFVSFNYGDELEVTHESQKYFILFFIN